MGMSGESPFAGRRIAVYGPTGSGKTSLGAEVARRLGVPHMDLDVVHWRPGWQENPREQFRADVEGWLDARAGGWVCSGNYASVVGDLVVARARHGALAAAAVPVGVLAAVVAHGSSIVHLGADVGLEPGDVPQGVPEPRLHPALVHLALACPHNEASTG